MNTRRKLLQAKESVPSTKWHLMKEAYYPIILSEWREHVEYWYNMGATGQQRELFRLICSEIYAQDEAKPDPTFSTQYTGIKCKEEATLLVKYYGKVLTKLGKDRARVWVLHVACNGWRRCNDFRDVFTGCQTIFENKSVLHTDYLPPEPQNYLKDSLQLQNPAKWSGLGLRAAMKPLQNEGAQAEAEEIDEAQKYEKMLVEKRPTYIVDACMSGPKTRFTKPKNQFDGFNILKALGYSDESSEETIAQLKAKQAAFQESETYCVDKDGSTLYKAEPVTSTRQRMAAVGNGRILDCATSGPTTQWRVKICD